MAPMCPFPAVSGLGATAAPVGAAGIVQSVKLQNDPVFGFVGGWRCNSQRMQLGYFHARRLLAHHWGWKKGSKLKQKSLFPA